MAEAPTQPGSPARSEAPTRSLRASLHPQARMQQLLAEQPKAEPDTEKNTEKNTPSHTEILAESPTGSLAEGMAEEDTDFLAEPDTEAHAPMQPPRRKAARKEAKAPVTTPGSASVRQRIIEDLQKEPVVRKTIDLPASLAERLQDYCAAKRIKTERRVFLVLLESFLDEEGF